MRFKNKEVEEYLKYKKTNNAINTYKFYYWGVNFLLKDDLIKKRHLEKRQFYYFLLTRLKELDVCNNTIIKLVKIVKNYLSFHGVACEWADIKGLKLEDNRHKFLTDEELAVIYGEFSALRPVQLLYLRLLLETGARNTELLSVKISNINIDNNRLLLDVTKNKLKRVVYFTEETKRLILAQVEEAPIDKLFYNFNYSAGRYLFKILSKKTGTNIYPHRFRHTFAQKLYMKGCPIATISDLLGHSDLTVTMNYIVLDNEKSQKDWVKYFEY